MDIYIYNFLQRSFLYMNENYNDCHQHNTMCTFIYKQKANKLRNVLIYKKQDNSRSVFIYKNQDTLRYVIFDEISEVGIYIQK